MDRLKQLTEKVRVITEESEETKVNDQVFFVCVCDVSNL